MKKDSEGSNLTRDSQFRFLSGLTCLLLILNPDGALWNHHQSVITGGGLSAY